MADEAYQEEYMNFIQPLNKLLGDESGVDWKGVSNEISSFCAKRNAELPEKGEKWCSPYFIKWDQAVCILAHSKKPIRCLAVIDVETGKFHRLVLKQKKGLNGGIRLCRASNSLLLAGSKRGFWCAHVGSVLMKMDMGKIEGSREVEEEMIRLYNKFVADMEINPFASKDESIAYKQQFDMTKYPNASWKIAVENSLKKPDKPKKRPSSPAAPQQKSRKRPCDWVDAHDVPVYAEGVLQNPTSNVTKEKLNTLLNKKMPSDKIFIQEELDRLEKEDRMDYTKSCDLSDAFLFEIDIPPPPPPEFNIED